MVQNEYMGKIKNIVGASGSGLATAEKLLCAVAFGENLSSLVNKNRKTQQIFNGLRRYKFIRRVREESEGEYLITPKGEKRLQNIIIEEIVIKNHPRWDGKWRLVMYDLPIRFKKARNAFRFKLKDLGFFQFQKSVWIYPYPCEEEILFVADFYGVRKYIEILEISKILNDKKLKEYFGIILK
jgi:hypothetical protein